MNDLTKYEQITAISFDHDGAHLALTHKLQGYSANKKPQPLLIKADEVEIPEEAREIASAINKGSDVRITVSMQEFLQRFFGVYGSDALVLAKIMGYGEEESSEPETYKEYIQERVESIELLRSAHENGKASLAVYGMIQKALEREELIKKDSHSGGIVINKDTASVDKTPSDGEKTKMTDVEKQAAELVQKEALLKQREEALEKATARIEALEKAEIERIEKSYIAMTKTFSFVKDEDKVTLAKAILSVEDKARAVVIEALEKAQEVIKQYVTKEEGFESGNDGVVGLEKTRSMINERIKNKYKTKE